MAKKDWLYYGLFINSNDKEKLMNLLKSDEIYNKLLQKARKVYIDHCTLLHNSQENEDLRIFCEQNIGSVIEITVEEVGVSNKAMAFKVDLQGIESANAWPHITICTFGDGKPVDSNFIVDWYILDKPINIFTTLERRDKNILDYPKI